MTDAFLKSNFADDVLKMALAPTFTQVAGILVIPLITRLYSPETFGLVALFYSIAAPLEAFTTMGFCTSIMLPARDEEGATMFAVSIFSALFAGLLTTLVIMIGQTAIKYWLKIPELKPYLWLVPISVCLSGIYMSLRYWSMRNRRFDHVAVGQASRYLTDNGFVLSAGILGRPTVFSLILGGMVGGLANSFVLAQHIFRDQGRLFGRNCQWPAILLGIKRYWKFPAFNIWNDLISRFAGQIPIYLLSYYFSQSIVGFYSLGLRLLNMPLSLIGTSIGEVYFQRAVQNISDNTLVTKLFERLVSFGILPFLLLAFVGEDLFIIALGTKWSEAGVYAQILSFCIFVRFITTPAGYLAIIYEKQEISFLVRVLETLISISSILMGGLYGDAHISFFLLSGFTGLLFAVYGFWFMNRAGLSLSNGLRIVSHFLLIASPLLLVVSLAKWYFDLSHYLIILVSCVGSLPYYAFVLRHDEKTRLIIIELLQRINLLGVKS
jgi:O-antigen/teichoic acid export membrane protein